MRKIKRAGRVAKDPADAGRKYRLYPTPQQAERLSKWGHTCRAVWNVALEQRLYVYKQRRKYLRADEQCRYLTRARHDLEWIGDLPSQAPQQVLRHLDQAYENFWNAEHPARFPRFKKRTSRMAIPLPGQAVRVRKLNRKWACVRIPKLGEVRFRLTRPLGGQVKAVSFRRDAIGRWYVSFSVHTGTASAPPNGQPPVGLDFGVKQSAYLSDEIAPRLMPQTLTKGERRRLAGLERRRERQIRQAKRHRGGKYSNRLRRTLRAIAELKSRQARRRADFTHKLTTDLAKNHGLVAIEDLRVKQMTRSARGTTAQPGVRVSQKAGLNRAVLDNLPGERRRQLVYKCAAYGSELVLVQPARTSQTCGACNLWDPASRLSRDTFACTGCGHTDDADHNASVVILGRALRDHVGAVFAAGQCGEQHAPTGQARPATSRTRTGRTREPLTPSSAAAEPSPDIEGYKESRQVTAGRMSKNKRVSGHARDTPKLSG
ncbi:RNA-guided endonuclease InsQ/TnpB family protein [Streptomyces sp. HD]|uniref:RNA-guided endonuclease InsQ/TnpB family protein n=1 Tax=Streptomyces sp. HD TaxID=3020892 RepID=UPI00232C270D|nr:transposase [Streptomyces sp. HD]MDC0773686.1 transposase [Streptomyces sp. HD]